MKKLKELSERNKFIKFLIKVLKGIFIIIILAFVTTVYLQRISSNKVSFFNYRMFTVITGSMEPKYKIGDVLFAKDVAASEIKIGDAISYLGAVGNFKDKIITHEVVDINKDSSGKYIFNTKGLTNLIEDPIVHENQLYGVIVYKSRFLSLIYKVIRTKVGFFLCILVPLVGIIGYELITTLLEKEAKRRS